MVHAPESVLRPIGISLSIWTQPDPVEFLNERRVDPDCASKIWQGTTFLEAVIPPMVEKPTVKRTPKGLWKFEMLLITRMNLEHGVQRIFKVRLIPLTGMNQALMPE
ncbi:hypothetical protein C5167_021890 [Papaver somniferum]|uniref:Uncharacterized protein n=1 Tax=Papaver somniferum TaxID=3469 RepID=A0A4Y7JHV9_PAPSO|nr:hypothetical protein C5167_021890 [Papaver somniferum]